MPIDHSSPAFVVGITGHMDIPEEDVPEIEERFRQLFRWLSEIPETADSPESDRPAWWPFIERRCLDESGEYDDRPLPGLGLENQRIVLLTSLAPGADTIAARIALEEGIEVRAPLPFPVDLYPRASTFTAASDPEKAVAEFQNLTGGETPPVETFPVLLASDIEKSVAEREQTFEADLENKDARNLRYRAAGEYVGTFCNVLFALFQPDAVGESSGASSQTIVDITRTGPTAGILPSASHFPWNEAVPVIHVPCRSEKRQRVSADDFSAENWRERSATFLPPLWLEACHMDDEGEVDPECERAGYSALQQSARLLTDYTNLAESGPFDSEKAVASLLHRKGARSDALSESGEDFLKKLAPLAAARERSAKLANKADAERKKMMTRMAIFAFLAAAFFHCFSHWHPKADSGSYAAHDPTHATPTPLVAEASVAAEPNDHHNSGGHDRIEISFLILTVATILCAYFSFLHYRRTKCEWLRFDARAFSEGLRVQFYWAASGLRGSVAEKYMHRQKGELDWMRNAISSLSFPYDRWAGSFDALPQKDQQFLIRHVISNWIAGQKDFFRKKTETTEHKLHRFHCFGWGMTLAGMMQTLLILIWKMTHPASDGRFLSYCGLALVVLAIVAAIVRHSRNRGEKHHGSGWSDQLFAHGPYPFGFAVSALICWMLVIFPPAHWTPGVKDLWIILTGVLLVSGAIAIAWSEKLLLSEHARQYRSMHALFQNAESHLVKLLGEWETNASRNDNYESISPKRQIQETLFDLGKEALDENAEWLVLHRSRPFEPFLAG